MQPSLRLNLVEVLCSDILRSMVDFQFIQFIHNLLETWLYVSHVLASFHWSYLDLVCKINRYPTSNLFYSPLWMPLSEMPVNKRKLTVVKTGYTVGDSVKAFRLVVSTIFSELVSNLLHIYNLSNPRAHVYKTFCTTHSFASVCVDLSIIARKWTYHRESRCIFSLKMLVGCCPRKTNYLTAGT